MLKKLFIRFRIWRLYREIRNIKLDIDIYYVNLNSRNLRFFSGKLNIDEKFNEYLKIQKEEVKRLARHIEILKNKLKSLD
jgi:Trm5-related predicted tRNA methylase